MILARLKEYADTQMPDLAPSMYRSTPVRWYVNLTNEGALSGEFTPLGGSGKADKRGVSLVVPDLVRTVGIKPKLLADNGEYALGVAKPDADSSKVAERHHQFKQLVKKCAEATKEPLVWAVSRFLEDWQPSFDKVQKVAPGFDPGDTVTFRVEGQFPVDLPSVQAFWAAYTSSGENTMQCLVTGFETVVEARMPGKIKGLPGGQMSGTSLVSANSQAFTSYGLENSLTSPISRDAAERFTKGLNNLLTDANSRFYVGSLVYVFWTRQPTGFRPGSLLSRPTPEQVKMLFGSPYAGEETHGLRANRFYALALSASGGRAVVRDWLETTIPAVEESLKRWFNGQRVVDPYGQPERYFRLNQLTEAAFRRSLADRKFDPAKEVPANVVQALTHSAFTGSRLPDDLLTRLVRRCAIGTEVKKDQRDHVTHAQAALLKLIFATQGVNMPEKLDPGAQMADPDRLAYQCGRLLAELDAIQRAALGQRNATVVDRFYGAASSTPSSAFAPLMTGLRAHLSKLRKTKPGTWQAKEEAVEDILDFFRSGRSETPKFPSTLTVQQQGVFALGFYHQRAQNRAKAKVASQTQLAQTQQGA